MRRLFGCPDIVSLTEKCLMARNFKTIPLQCIKQSQHENMQTYHAVDVLYEYLLGLPLAGPHFLIWL